MPSEEYKNALAEWQRFYFRGLLVEMKDDTQAVAARAGMNLTYLYKLFKRIGIKLPRGGKK